MSAPGKRAPDGAPQNHYAAGLPDHSAAQAHIGAAMSSVIQVLCADLGLRCQLHVDEARAIGLSDDNIALILNTALSNTYLDCAETTRTGDDGELLSLEQAQEIAAEFLQEVMNARNIHVPGTGGAEAHRDRAMNQFRRIFRNGVEDNDVGGDECT